MNKTPQRVAIITGASAGIGEAVALDLHNLGHSLIINARRNERLEDLKKRLGNDRIACVSGDASDDDVISAMFAKAKSQFGRDADLVVVNAGRGLKGSVVTSDPTEWEEIVRINILGAQRLMRKAASCMLSQVEQSGIGKKALDIVVLGSVVGRHISPFSSAYGATKFAVNSLAEALRRELASKGIRVTLIEPGLVKTEFQDVAKYERDWFSGLEEKMGPVLEAADVSKAISFAVSLPWHIHTSDILIRPTRQDYP